MYYNFTIKYKAVHFDVDYLRYLLLNKISS